MAYDYEHYRTNVALNNHKQNTATVVFVLALLTIAVGCLLIDKAATRYEQQQHYSDIMKEEGAMP